MQLAGIIITVSSGKLVQHVRVTARACLRLETGWLCMRCACICARGKNQLSRMRVCMSSCTVHLVSEHASLKRSFTFW